VLPIRPWEQAARLLDYGFALERGNAESVGEFPPHPKSTAAHESSAAPAASGAGWGWAQSILLLGGLGVAVALLLTFLRPGSPGPPRRRRNQQM
jgi:hypothetical protein